MEMPIAMAFSVAFVRHFLADQPNYRLAKGQYGASRSNWTYHTALAIAQAAKLMDLVCRFETSGKRDAVIETRDDPPDVVVVAEWEWDGDDVFGAGKELEKLRQSCRGNRWAQAFLLTYCTESTYPDFLQRVAEYWIGVTPRRRSIPVLYLHAVIYEEQGNIREFQRLRTATIDGECVEMWMDELF